MNVLIGIFKISGILNYYTGYILRQTLQCDMFYYYMYIKVNIFNCRDFCKNKLPRNDI